MHYDGVRLHFRDALDCKSVLRVVFLFGDIHLLLVALELHAQKIDDIHLFHRFVELYVFPRLVRKLRRSRNVNLHTEPLHDFGIAVRHARMRYVAHQSYFQSFERAVLLVDRHKVEKRLRGVIARAVAAVKNRDLDRFQVPIINVFRMSYDHSVHSEALESTNGIVERFAFGNARRGEIEGKRRDTEIDHRHLEAVLRTGGILIKKVDHFLPGEVDCPTFFETNSKLYDVHYFRRR